MPIDLGLPYDIPDGAVKEAIDAAKRITIVDGQRVRVWTYASAVAMTFPRRLGAEATREQMSLDKKIGKVLCHSYHVLWSQMAQASEAPIAPAWGAWSQGEDDPQIRRIGATVVWVVQIPKLIETVERRIEKVESHPTPIKPLRRWQRRRVHMLESEVNSLKRVAKLLPE